MISSVSAVAPGVSGIAQIVGTLNQLKDFYGRLPAIRAVAVQLIGGTGDHNQAAQISALARFVRGAIGYVCDPLNAEFIQTPDVLLLQIHERGQAWGDCDDFSLLFASLAEAIGIPAQIVGVASQSGGPMDHVITIVQLDAGPLEFDLIAKGKWQPAYGAKLTAG